VGLAGRRALSAALGRAVGLGDAGVWAGELEEIQKRSKQTLAWNRRHMHLDPNHSPYDSSSGCATICLQS